MEKNLSLSLAKPMHKGLLGCRNISRIIIRITWTHLFDKYTYFVICFVVGHVGIFLFGHNNVRH